MVVTDLRISFPFVKVDNGSILEVLWDSLLSSHALKQLCQFFCHWKSTSFIDELEDGHANRTIN